MPSFTFEFVTLSTDLEQTLKAAVLPVRRAIGRSIADAMEAPMNNVQAKRLGISRHLAGERENATLTPEQKLCSDGTTERWVNNVIEISRQAYVANPQTLD